MKNLVLIVGLLTACGGVEEKFYGRFNTRRGGFSITARRKY